MSLFTAQAGLSFPASLSEKYRPHLLQDFVGLEKPKKVIAKFADAPFPNAAFLFVGPSGTGKTSMALALCQAIRGELHHIPSQSCNVSTVEDVTRQCHYVPRNNTLHVVLVDEADQMSNAAQLSFLSKLDGTARFLLRRFSSSLQTIPQNSRIDSCRVAWSFRSLLRD
jgi:replication-associated recombination protein RarA